MERDGAWLRASEAVDRQWAGWPVPWVPSAAWHGGAKGLFRTPQRSEGWQRGRQGLGQSGSIKDFLDKSCSHDIISLSDARQFHLQSPLQALLSQVGAFPVPPPHPPVSKL